MVILNKTDCVNEAEWDGIDAMVAEHLRPAVKTLRASHGQIDASVLLGLGMEAEDDLDSRPSHHDDGHEHDHEDFDSFVIDLGETGDADTFLTRLETVIRDHDILRVKGFLAVEGKNMRLAVQAVGGRIQRYFDRDWRGDDVRSSRLVVIGHHGLDETAISTALRD